MFNKAIKKFAYDSGVRLNYYLSVLGYFEGIVGNLELMSTYYPGWIMRLYYDLDDKDPITQVIYSLFY